MGSHMTAVFLCVLALGYRVAGNAAIQAKPLDIVPGVTSTFTVNCSFTWADISSFLDFHYITALDLSKSDDGSLLSYTIVALVSGLYPDTRVSVDLGATTVTGHWLQDGEAYVALTWDNPSEAQAGYYSCTAFGSGTDNSPKLLEKFVHVTSGGGSVVG